MVSTQECWDFVAQTKKPALPPALIFFLHAPRLERSFQRLLLLAGDGALDRRLHLFKGADFDLPYAFARHAEFGGEIFQRHRLFGQTPRLEDPALTRVEHADRPIERVTAMIELLVFGHQRFLV